MAKRPSTQGQGRARDRSTRAGASASGSGALSKPVTKGGGKEMSASSKAGPILLAGGNPQIAKGDGDEAVRLYLAVVPGWKREVCQRLDELIRRAVPDVRRCVRWNAPMYGVDGVAGMMGTSWFASMNCTTRYVKVTFYNGQIVGKELIDPQRNRPVRYLHVHEGDLGDVLLEQQVMEWMAASSQLPGWSLASLA